jgi:DNA-binding NarL/FixJ family response regulator
MPCRLLLADDHELVRKNLREIIEFKTDCVVVCEAKDGLQAVSLAKEFEPDIALVDISMPGLDGLDAARQIRRENPQTKILILTMHDAAPLITKMREVGVQGYLLKSEAPQGLPLAINSLLRNQLFFGPAGNEQLHPEKTP